MKGEDTNMIAYRNTLKKAFSDGACSDDENAMIETLRESFAIPYEQHQRLMDDIMMDFYIDKTQKKGEMINEDVQKRNMQDTGSVHKILIGRLKRKQPRI